MSADRVRNHLNQGGKTPTQVPTGNQNLVPNRLKGLLAHFSICLAKKDGVPMMSGQYIAELSMYAGFNPVINGKEVRVLKPLVYNLSEVENLNEMLASARRNYAP